MKSIASRGNLLCVEHTHKPSQVVLMCHRSKFKYFSAAERSFGVFISLLQNLWGDPSMFWPSSTEHHRCPGMSNFEFEPIERIFSILSFWKSSSLFYTCVALFCSKVLPDRPIPSFPYRYATTKIRTKNNFPKPKSFFQLRKLNLPEKKHLLKFDTERAL